MFVPSRMFELATAEELKRFEQTSRVSLGKVGSTKGMRVDILSCAVSMQLSIMSRDLGNRVNPLSLNVPENVERIATASDPEQGSPSDAGAEVPMLSSECCIHVIAIMVDTACSCPAP